MALITIIIPVYNAIQYFQKCIDSIMNQDYTSFSVILIDDGSKDDSLRLIKDYCKDDNRFEVISKANGGVASARNVGIATVKTPFLTFVDIDDYIDPTYLSDLLALQQSEPNIDLVIQGFKRVNDKGEIISQNTLLSGIVSAKDLVTIFNKHKLQDNGYVCSKLYKTAILLENNIQFDPSIHLYEDTLFVLQYLKYVNTLVFSDQNHYNYLLVTGSLTTKQRDFNTAYLPFRKLVDQANAISTAAHAELNSLFERMAIYMHDAIIAIYLNKYNQHQRLEYLNTFSDNDWELYKANFHPYNKIIAIFKSLLLNRKFKIADLIMNLYYNRK